MKSIRNTLIVLAALYAGCIVYALVPQQSVPVESLAGKYSQFINVNGRMLHFEKYGIGKPLVLVHGFAGSTYTWRHVIPLLAQHHEVYAVDLPGFGLSDKPADGNYLLQEQAGMIIGFMDALQLKTAALAGHSMGGVIVGMAAVKAPNKIDKLIVIDAGYYHGGPPEFLKHLVFPFDIIMARSFYTKGARSKSLVSSYYNTSLVTDEVLENYLKPGRTPNAAAALARMLNTATRESYHGISTRITTPTLLIWARQDKPIPLTDGERLHQEIKGSQFLIIDNAGHMVQEEKPQEVAAAILKFLEH
ncbi:MAG: alpha/beta hydrolase [Deltaproteobacteria bacterium]|nr:alpha/beta hydrolase [Deltaproteobacteria bacterium]